MGIKKGIKQSSKNKITLKTCLRGFLVSNTPRTLWTKLKKEYAHAQVRVLKQGKGSLQQTNGKGYLEYIH